MHRLTGILVAFVTLVAWPSAAHFITTDLAVRPLGGCKVEVKVRLMRGLTGSHAVVRGRARFAFENERCTQQVRESKASAASDSEEREYDAFTFVDEVCADGRWFYHLMTKGPESDATQIAAEGFDPYSPMREVNVTGCKRKACPASLEAPARIVEGAPEPPPCKVETQMGYMDEGDVRQGEKYLGKLIRGADVIELKKEGDVTQVKALAPGKAWVESTQSPGARRCAEFTVAPNHYKRPSLRQKKRWAYREFASDRAAHDTLVRVNKGQRWPLPVSGTAVLVPHEAVVRLGVNEACEPSLLAKGWGTGPFYTGVKVTDAQGADHLYFVTLEEDPPELECRVHSSVTLMTGTTERIDLPPVRVAGEELIQRLPDSLVRGLRPGTVWLANTPEEDTCTRVTVEAAPETQQARIAWVTQRLSVRPTLVPTVIQMKVGEAQRLPMPIRSLVGTNNGVADIVVRTSTLVSRNAGFTGFLARTPTGEEHFLYVEVSEPEAQPKPGAKGKNRSSQ